MGVFAAIGWASFGLAGIALAIFVLRNSGLRADLVRSESDRDRLSAELSEAAQGRADDIQRLETELGDLLSDLERARDDLGAIISENPDLAVDYLDDAIARARAIGSGSGANSPGASDGEKS